MFGVSRFSVCYLGKKKKAASEEYRRNDDKFLRSYNHC